MGTKLTWALILLLAVLAGPVAADTLVPLPDITAEGGAILTITYAGTTYVVADGDLVRVRFPGERAVVLENVLIRVAKTAALELHLDTDDANAADVRAPMTVEILR